MTRWRAECWYVTRVCFQLMEEVLKMRSDEAVAQDGGGGENHLTGPDPEPGLV